MSYFVPMSELKTLLKTPEQTRRLLQTATLEQLQQALANLQQVIDAERESLDQQQLERKGKRVLSDMRSLMAKAGVSMDDLQAVLPK